MRATAAAGDTSIAMNDVSAASAPRTTMSAMRSSVTARVMKTSPFRRITGRKSWWRALTRVVPTRAAAM